MLLAACALSGATPARTLMVGDSPHDMEAARAAGMVPVAVLTGPARRPQLEPLARAVLPSIAALPRWLDAAGERRSAA